MEVERRAAWIEEEAQELREAITIEAQADAFIDAIYFAVGGLVNLACGRRPSGTSSRTPTWPSSGRTVGRVTARATGKVIKPDGWEDPGPKLAAEIRRQLDDAGAQRMAAE